MPYLIRQRHQSVSVRPFVTMTPTVCHSPSQSPLCPHHPLLYSYVGPGDINPPWKVDSLRDKTKRVIKLFNIQL